MTDPASRSLTIRIPLPINDQMMASVDKAGCTVTQWVIEAICFALEQDSKPHVPAKVLAAMPKRVGNLMSLPEGIQYRNL